MLAQNNLPLFHYQSSRTTFSTQNVDSLGKIEATQLAAADKPAAHVESREETVGSIVILGIGQPSRVVRDIALNGEKAEFGIVVGETRLANSLDLTEDIVF